jgi:hypothetical protein
MGSFIVHHLELILNRLIMEHSPLLWHIVEERPNMISNEASPENPQGSSYRDEVVGLCSLRCLVGVTKM